MRSPNSALSECLSSAADREAATIEAAAVRGLLRRFPVMDDAFKAYITSFIFLLALLSGFTGRAAELEYISPAQSQALADRFAAAGLRPADERVLASKWVCDMYGVRSRLQVQRGINLYRWSRESALWKNGGAQPVTEYRYHTDHTRGELVGRTARLEDEVRLTADGQLISRLSASAPSAAVIAYSVCKPQ